MIDFGNLNGLFQKYVGYSAIVVDSEEESNFERYKVIKGEEGKVAIACKDEDEQQAIVEDLVKQGYKFMITNTNIELIYLNALAYSNIAKKEVEA